MNAYINRYSFRREQCRFFYKPADNGQSMEVDVMFGYKKTPNVKWELIYIILMRSFLIRQLTSVWKSMQVIYLSHIFIHWGCDKMAAMTQAFSFFVWHSMNLKFKFHWSSKWSIKHMSALVKDMMNEWWPSLLTHIYLNLPRPSA